jgi:hypothetical protein
MGWRSFGVVFNLFLLFLEGCDFSFFAECVLLCDLSTEEKEGYFFTVCDTGNTYLFSVRMCLSCSGSDFCFCAWVCVFPFLFSISIRVRMCMLQKFRE